MAPVPEGRKHGLTALAERVGDSALVLEPLDVHCPPNLPLMAAAPPKHEMKRIIRIVKVGEGDSAFVRIDRRHLKPSTALLPDPARQTVVAFAVGALLWPDCVSACKFDPMRRGIGVQL